MKAMRILITGASGWTAQSIIQAVKEAGHWITAFDLPTAHYNTHIMPLLDQPIAGDIAHFDDIHRAVQTADAIIHLAVAVGKNDYSSPQTPFAVNVQGTYNLFEAARREGIQKIVLMSSAAVHLDFGKEEKLNALTDWKSSPDQDHLYDLTKRLQEEIAKDFSQTYQMSVVTLRAGHIVDGQQEVNPHNRPLSQVTYARGGWVCRYDLARACVKALELENNGYVAFHVIGVRQARTYFDIERTERELGLTCKIQFERYV
jgi:nucleoside-diphosphate-sugar epimerase